MTCDYGRTYGKVEAEQIEVTQALSKARDLPEEVSAVAQRNIAGAGFEPATFGL